MNKSALVTGGAGFIGSHLVASLLNDGYDVIALDNFFTGSRHNLDYENLILKPRGGSGIMLNLEIVRHDVCEPFHFDVDEIYHLACPASPVHYQRNPVRTIETAVLGTSNALRCARDAKASIFIASTSEIYGDPEVHPQKEGYTGNVNTIGPRSCYDEGKRCGETLASSYRTQYDVDVRIARIFNTYGPHMHENDGRVISNFIVQALKGESITVYGSGKQTRSFCYVSDMVSAIRALMNVPRPDVQTPVNLGNPHEVTIKEVAELIMAEARKGLDKGAIEYLKLPADDPKRRCPNITLASRMLSWQPEVSLDQGLFNTIEYFRDRLGLRTAR